MADEPLQPETDAPPGDAPAADAAADAGAEQPSLELGADASADTAPAKAKAAATKAKAATADVPSRDPPRKTAVARILRGHFYEGDFRRPTRKGPGQMIELPIEEIERFQRLGLLEDKRRILPLASNGPRFFRDDAPSARPPGT